MTTWTPPVMETERLHLRRIEVSDAESIFEYASVPDVTKHVLWDRHESIADTMEFIKDYSFKNYEQKILDPMGITLKEKPDKLIGTVGAKKKAGAPACYEMGYVLSQKHWGKGIVVEAASALMNYLFDELSAERIQAHCNVENTGSSRVMEKLGMRREGTARSRVFKKNRYWDIAFYGILKSDRV